MIKLENYEVVGWEHAIRGMRNPKNSWGRSDSVFKETAATTALVDGKTIPQHVYYDALAIGENDHELMTTLAKGGPVHAKYRRMITVYVDITAPLYWWKEFDTYKVGTVANSCSTMHKIADKEFTLEDFSCEHLIDITKPTVKSIDDDCVPFEESGSGATLYWTATNILELTIEALNTYRQRYLETKDKKYWWQMIQLLPSSYNQKRTVMLNYEVLANIHKWRKNHKMNDGHWDVVIEWIEQLPYAELIVGEPKTEIAYLCDGESCNSCDNIDCNHTLDIKHAVNFEKVGDHKYMEVERSPLAHPETYVSDAIAMIGDMTMAQRVEVMKYLNVKTPNKCPYWNYENHTSSHTCNGCEDHGVLINGDRYCTLVGDDE